jgi:hypothetical protein
MYQIRKTIGLIARASDVHAQGSLADALAIRIVFTGVEIGTRIEIEAGLILREKPIVHRKLR